MTMTASLQKKGSGKGMDFGHGKKKGPKRGPKTVF